MANCLNSFYMYFSQKSYVSFHQLVCHSTAKVVKIPLIRYHINDAHKNGLREMRKAPPSKLCKGEKIIQRDICSLLFSEARV